MSPVGNMTSSQTTDVVDPHWFTQPGHSAKDAVMTKRGKGGRWGEHPGQGTLYRYHVYANSEWKMKLPGPRDKTLDSDSGV